MERAWCCYEIALFNKRCVSDDSAKLRSFVAPSRTIYHGWDAVATTEIEDKSYIEKEITGNFPKGFEGFNEVMNQANAVAILALTERNEFNTPDALDNLGNSVEKWFDRIS